MPPEIQPMWRCGDPDPEAPGAGFPMLERAAHQPIFTPDRDAGAYNHHSQLAIHRGVFHAMWSNHTRGEDGPGQRILLARTDDPADWPDPTPLFPSPQPMTDSEQMGLALTAFRWVTLEDRLFAIAGCHDNIGFCDFDRTDFVAERDADHPARARKGYSSLAREVEADGGLGPIFAVWPDLAEGIAFEVLACDDPAIADAAAGLRDALTAPLGMPAWDFRGHLAFPDAWDGHRLCEPTVYRAADGRYVMLLRDLGYSHRMFRSISDDGNDWPPALPTDIPDSPSLSTTLTLEDGTVLLIGNQMAPRFDNPDKVTHYQRDPLMVCLSPDGYTFTRACALRCGVQHYRVPQSEVRGRGGGPQYPSAARQEDTLHVLYSMGKEDIWLTSVPLEDIIEQTKSPPPVPALPRG